MSINIKFQKSLKEKGAAKKSGLAVVYVYKGGKLSAAAAQLDKESGGLIKRAVKTAEKFSGKYGEFLSFALPAKAGFDQVVCAGLGNPSELDALKAEALGGKLFVALQAQGRLKATLITDDLKQKTLGEAEFIARLAIGVQLRSYKFERYKAKKAGQKVFKEFSIIGEESIAAKKIFSGYSNTAKGVFTARDLVNEPPNALHPEAYAKFIKKELSPLGIKVEILDEKKMKTLGMGAILAVGQGSQSKPRMVIMRWNGAAKSKKTSAPIALVGKGVTFDTGGISIKPAGGMDEMKMDMGGSAAVVGTMQALALNKVKANVVAVVGLAENMLSHNAYRPGDIIKSYSGKTIEVLNTDAEGRLVLADCLTYVQKKYKPSAIIDLATLTGAMMVALGHEYCGTFSNDNKLWSGLERASADTGENLWRMPLDDIWKKDMESVVADLKNMGGGRFAGACTAAGFLEHFIDEGTPWAHMDIAGTAWVKKDKPTVPKFGTGFGVRVLERFIADNYT